MKLIEGGLSVIGQTESLIRLHLMCFLSQISYLTRHQSAEYSVKSSGIILEMANMGKEPRGDIILRHLLYEIVISADRSFCSDKLKTSMVRQSGLEVQVFWTTEHCRFSQPPPNR